MTDAELLAHILDHQWRTPLRKLWCLLAHRRQWWEYLDWATGQVVIAVRCDRCGQRHMR